MCHFADGPCVPVPPFEGHPGAGAAGCAPRSSGFPSAEECHFPQQWWCCVSAGCGGQGGTQSQWVKQVFMFSPCLAVIAYCLLISLPGVPKGLICSLDSPPRVGASGLIPVPGTGSTLPHAHLHLWVQPDASLCCLDAGENCKGVSICQVYGVNFDTFCNVRWAAGIELA
jgi:hypothetical protein